jgi:tetratricopeptide (TPR) repeat protein
VASGEECRILRDPERAGGSSADISPDGRLLAVSGERGLRLWDLPAGKLVTMLPASLSRWAGFDRLGRWMLTSGPAGVFRWPLRAEAGAHLNRLALGPAEALPLPLGSRTDMGALDAGGRNLLVRNNLREALLFNLDRPAARPRSFARPDLWSLALSPDGKWAGICGWNDPHARVWDVAGDRSLLDIPAKRARLIFSPDGRRLLVGMPQSYAFYEAGSWQLWERLPGDPTGASAGPACFARDGRLLALTVARQTICLLDPRTRIELATLDDPELQRLNWLCFSPDGSQLVSGTATGVIQVWDLLRLRAQLGEIGLDWGDPLAAPPAPVARRPLDVRLDYGDVGAAQKYSLILAFFPWHAEASYQRGLAYSRGSRWRQAADDFTRTLLLKPDYADAWYQRGVVQAQEGRFQQAIDDFSRSLALQGDRTEAYVERAQAHIALERWQDAARDYARALAHDPQDVSLWHGKAFAQLASRDTAAYRQTCADALGRWGAAGDSHTAVLLVWTCAVAAESGVDAERLVRLAQQLVSATPTEYLCARALGAALVRAGRYEEAVRELERAASLNAEAPISWLLLAISHHRLGHAAEARSWFDRASRRIERFKVASAWQAIPWHERLGIELLHREAEALL